jgi:hypothetical protein
VFTRLIHIEGSLVSIWRGREPGKESAYSRKQLGVKLGRT